jgi:hypothetical protein
MPEERVEKAYILLRVKQQMVDKALEQILALPFVKEASVVIGGGYDIIVKVEHEESFHAAYTVMQEIWNVPGIMEDQVLPVKQEK